MLCDADHYNDVAVRASVTSRVTLASIRHGLTVVDTRRYIDSELFLLLYRTATLTMFTFIGNDFSLSAALRTYRLDYALSENSTLNLLDVTAAVTLRTHLYRTRVFSSRTVTYGTTHGSQGEGVSG